MVKKILIVFGTRPEAIKIAPLVLKLKENSENFQTIVCVTGQHREMLDQVLKLFEIVPDYDLNLMKKGQDLYDITAGVLLGLRGVLTDLQPDLVLVHGDTSTSTAAALAAYYKQIPVGHVEAGLRTHDIYSPFPEEANRQLTARIAKYHFAPTATSKANLIIEGVFEGNIVVTGNTGIDALHIVSAKIHNIDTLKSTIISQLISLGLPNNILEQWSATVNKRKLVLITGHRRENFGQGFINICKAIKALMQLHPDVDFVYPVHLNPNVRQPIQEIFYNESDKVLNSNMFFIEPLEYLPFVYLMNLADIILTDSGGIQEEAPSLGKPVLVMRNTTERPEAVESGCVKLVGTDQELIINEVSRLIRDNESYSRMSKAINPYGDGKASIRIINHILQ
jgi:UDP-N-acetylglucosamine 2-epimerase (non-hydrolysing)